MTSKIKRKKIDLQEYLPILPICRLATIFAIHVLFIHLSHVNDKSTHYKNTTSEAKTFTQVEQCHVMANTLFNTYVIDIVNIITRGMVRYLTP